ncbi:cold shock domain-containing protein [Salmonella enterica subsp. enterica serovar Derby]|nr:cold shock domain-containing protein [Salmonella enterica subsp. enterica serovar Derby]
MTGIVKNFDGISGKGLIITSDGCLDVQLHVSALNRARSPHNFPKT